jgi:hypothetical protein
MELRLTHIQRAEYILFSFSERGSKKIRNQKWDGWNYISIGYPLPRQSSSRHEPLEFYLIMDFWWYFIKDSFAIFRELITCGEQSIGASQVKRS